MMPRTMDERSKALTAQIAALSPDEQHLFLDLVNAVSADRREPPGPLMERLFFMRYLARSHDLEGS